MAYMRNDLISRAGYSGVGDIWDSISGAVGSVVKFYGAEQQAQGAAAAAAAQNRDLTNALAAKQGIDTTTMLLIGGVGLAAFLMLRKKS